MSDDKITITQQEYNELKMAKEKLTKLEGAGVDNWEGYDYAMSADDES